jgi:hypothetical protein
MIPISETDPKRQAPPSLPERLGTLAAALAVVALAVTALAVVALGAADSLPPFLAAAMDGVDGRQ